MNAKRRAGKRAGQAERAVDTAESQARLAVNLPIQLHRQLKARAAEEGTSIRDYILEMLRRNGIG